MDGIGGGIGMAPQPGAQAMAGGAAPAPPPSMGQPALGAATPFHAPKHGKHRTVGKHRRSGRKPRKK
jgi:hypothetical protein